MVIAPAADPVTRSAERESDLEHRSLAKTRRRRSDLVAVSANQRACDCQADARARARLIICSVEPFKNPDEIGLREPAPGV